MSTFSPFFVVVVVVIFLQFSHFIMCLNIERSELFRVTCKFSTS